MTRPQPPFERAAPRAIQSLPAAIAVYDALHDHASRLRVEGAFRTDVAELVLAAAAARTAAVLSAFRLYDVLVEDTKNSRVGWRNGFPLVYRWELERAGAGSYSALILDLDGYSIDGGKPNVRVYRSPQRVLLAAILRAWIELYSRIEGS